MTKHGGISMSRNVFRIIICFEDTTYIALKRLGKNRKITFIWAINHQCGMWHDKEIQLNMDTREEAQITSLASGEEKETGNTLG